MNNTLARCSTRDGELLYDWLHANFRYFMAGETPAIDGQGRPTKDRRGQATLQALVEQLTYTEHERALRFAIGGRFEDELGPVEDGCECRWCAPARQRQEQERQRPREQRVRDELVQTLTRQFQGSSRHRRCSRCSGLGSYSRPIRVVDRDAERGTLPSPPVKPSYKKSFAPLRFFFGTEERLSVFLEVVPPAWPLLSKLLGPPPTGEDAEYPPDVLSRVTAVAAHLAYAPRAGIEMQRKILAWTWGEPKIGGSCQMSGCKLPKELSHARSEVPDDRVHHKFGHALEDLLLDPLRHKCPVNRGLGMPLIQGRLGYAHVRHLIVGNPYVYYPH